MQRTRSLQYKALKCVQIYIDLPCIISINNPECLPYLCNYQCIFKYDQKVSVLLWIQVQSCVYYLLWASLLLSPHFAMFLLCLTLPFEIVVLQTPGSSSVPEFFRIMSRHFTAHEWSTIHSAGSEEEQLAAFYRHWVRMATALPCHHIMSLQGHARRP